MFYIANGKISDLVSVFVIAFLMPGFFILSSCSQSDGDVLGQTQNREISRENLLRSNELIKFLKLRDYSKVKELVSAGADLKVRDENGYTILQIAMRHDSEEILSFLIENGADASQEIVVGTHPLETALIKADNDRSAYILLKGGADPNTKIADRSVLMDAIIKKKGELATFLLGKGARTNTENRLGRTELFYVSGQLSPVVKELLEKGANPNHRDVEGTTPLFLAIQNNDLILVRTLIENGGDVNAADSHGWTPMKEALAFGCEEIITLLRSKEARLDQAK